MKLLQLEFQRRSAVLNCLVIGSVMHHLFLQSAAWPLGFLMRYCSMLRNRMLADPSFLFKVGTEVSLSLFICTVFMCISW